ncbi:MAG TPA: hypothetical protein V6D29_09485 [Leptolyngbyaceae cyanobacterium]
MTLTSGQREKVKSALTHLGIPFFEHRKNGREVPGNLRFPGIWFEPDGIHFQPAICSVGRLLHDVGHWIMMRPEDRARVKPGCLRDQGITSCLEDFVCDPLAFAIAELVDIRPESLFTDTEDYRWGTCGIVSPSMRSRYIACIIYSCEHVGVSLLQAAKMCDETFPEMLSWTLTEEAIKLQGIIDFGKAEGVNAVKELDVNEAIKRSEIYRIQDPSLELEIAKAFTLDVT